MSSIDPRKPSWAPKEMRRPQDASDTSEEEEDEYLRRAAPYEVRLQLGPIEYGQDVSYYDDNQSSLTDLTYLQRQQLRTDRSLFRKDKKGRVIKDSEKSKLEKRRQRKIERFKRKKEERRQAKPVENPIAEDEHIAEGLPLSFGKQKKILEYTDDEINSFFRREKEDSNSDGTNESDYDDFPVTHEIKVDSHSKALVDIDVDHTDNRMITGSIDHTIKIYDFGLMNESLEAFRSFSPIEGHPIRTCKYNKKHILVCAGGPQVKVFSKEGRVQYECIRGDMYMTDMLNTHGHVSTVTHAEWHPSKPTFFLTSSLDSTVRIWDLHGRLIGMDKNMGHRTLHKARSARFTKVGVDCCTWGLNDQVAGGCADFSLQLWQTDKGNSVQPVLTKPGAHEGEITCVKFMGDKLLSRSQDSTLKLWDLRKFSEALQVWNHLPSTNYRTQIDLHDQYILTGSSKGLHIFSSESYNEEKRIELPSEVISVKWIPQFNQILTGSSNGQLRSFYSPGLSTGGFLPCVKKKIREENPNDFHLDKPVFTPYSNPQFKPEHYKRIKDKQKKLEDPLASHKPKEPIFELDRDLRMTGINTVTQFIIRSANEKSKREEGEDPREILLSHSLDAAKNPEWVAPAYKESQPQTIYDYTIDNEPEREYLYRNNMPICKSCGLKFCKCWKRRLGDDPVFHVEKKNK